MMVWNEWILVVENVMLILKVIEFSDKNSFRFSFVLIDIEGSQQVNLSFVLIDVELLEKLVILVVILEVVFDIVDIILKFDMLDKCDGWFIYIYNLVKEFN